ncbi:hypothetical protein E3N88_04907 [Mikania micrantha]|uniref:Uncharacterized protein n=1 Tax=Mikania micrantha TaxID=192012 RepID=A0A5N6P5E8_9ASTR|nr:hypothetical protein E3N88_12348 [Mikania micrantha]KAD7117639.1 hypothetical protein E3N88_04907 [Mikania micrantha]
MSEIVSTKSKNIEVDSSRYAMAPRRKASRYAKKSGSRDSRILSRYATNNFDRPPRYAKAMQIKIFYKSIPFTSYPIFNHFLRTTSAILDQNPPESKLKPLLTPLEAIVGDWKPLEHQREFLEATNKQDDPHQPSFELPEPVTPRI